MTRDAEVRQLIHEQTLHPEERRELEQVAHGLERLGDRVPYRADFRADLRKRLMAEARKQMRPWYLRTQTIAVAGAMAAAVGTFALLNVFTNQDPGSSPVHIPPIATNAPEVAPQSQPEPAKPTEKDQPKAVQLVDPKAIQPKTVQVGTGVKVTVVQIPDQWEGAQPKAGAVSGKATFALSSEVKAPASPAERMVYAIQDVPGQAGLEQRARQMGFTGAVTTQEGVLLVRHGNRTLELHPDGRMIYNAPAEGAVAAAAPDAPAAEKAARAWLNEAGLIAPAGSPQVVKAESYWRVTFTPVLPGGAQAISEALTVWVATSGHVIRAEALTGVLFEVGPVPIHRWEEALLQLGARPLVGVEGDLLLQVRQVELVYARPSSLRAGDAIQLQPYWRFTAATPSGAIVHRHVPAAKQ